MRPPRRWADESAQRLTAIADWSEDAIICKNLDGIITTWNSEAERLFGYKASEAIGRKLAALIPRGLKEEAAILQRVRRGERLKCYETIRRRKNGSLIHVSITASPVLNGNGKIIGIIKFARDITDRKRMETELQAWQQQLESRVARQKEQARTEASEQGRLEAEVARAVESEQLRLGQELHDGLTQELVAMAAMVEVLEWKLVKISSTRAREARRIRVRLKMVIVNTRKLAKGFYPVEIEQQGLLFALQEFAKRTQRTFKIVCSVKSEKSVANWKDGKAVQLFRIAQEAIRNAAKHARAKKVLVRLIRRDGAWILTVKDDGVGLHLPAKSPAGMGLQIMHYRARMIGATCEIRNARGGGVVVSCKGAWD